MTTPTPASLATAKLRNNAMLFSLLFVVASGHSTNAREIVVQPEIMVERPEALAEATDIRFVIYVPEDLHKNNPRWQDSRSILGFAATPEPYVLVMDQAFKYNVLHLFCNYFPSCTASTERPHPGTYDLLAVASFEARTTVYTNEIASTSNALNLKTLHFSAAIRIEDSNNELVTVLRSFSRDRHFAQEELGKISYLRRVAGSILKMTFNSLSLNLRDSQSLHQQVKILAKERARPCNLDLQASFDDSAGFLPNRKLDAGEQAHIIAEIVNRGAETGPALGVILRVNSEDENVVVRNTWDVGDLSPGEKKEISVPVVAGLEIPANTLQLHLTAEERRGYGAPPVQLEIQGAELELPDLAITDIVLNDRIGRAKGDGDGAPANGETVEVTLRIENHGPGDAVGLRFDLLNPVFEVQDPPSEVSRIPAGQSREAVTLLKIPPAYTNDEITLRIAASDIRGTEVGSADIEKTWRLVHKGPLLEPEYRLYDGTSPGSFGDGDGIANNGERIELGVVLVNRGSLIARDVRLSFSTDHPELSAPETSSTLDDLPIGARAPEQRVPVLIPRQFRSAAELSRLTFRLHLQQADFPSSELVHSIAFQPRNPVVAVGVNAPDVLDRGKQNPLLIQVWNKGQLDAENVTVEVESTAGGVELYEPNRGVMKTQHFFDLGTLAVGDRAVNLSLTVLPRQDASPTLGGIRVRVRQDDFSFIEREFPLRIENKLVIVPVEPQEQPLPEPASTTGTSVAPSIAFLTEWKTGDQVKIEDLLLRFEIQVAAGTFLSSVHLEHRTDEEVRDLVLGLPVSTQSIAGRVVETYEVPVDLAYGPNHLTVTAMLKGDRPSRRRLSLNRIPDVGRWWVVAIGVGEYKDERIRDLDFARQDSQAIHDYYRNTFKLPPEQLFLVQDEQATYRQIMELLGETLPQRAGPDDTVILFFAGHGMIERDLSSVDADGLSKYLVPWDADPKHLFSTGINMDIVGRIFARLAAGSVIVLADTCFSGAAGGRTVELQTSIRSSLTDDFLDRVVSGQGRLILTASGANEVAEERASLGHGVFTHHILQGLEGQADEDCDGFITSRELYSYVFRQVSQETEGRQNPTQRQSGVQIGEVVVGQSRQRCTLNE